MTFLPPTILCIVLLAWAVHLSCPRRRERFFKQETPCRATWRFPDILLSFLLYVALTWTLFPVAQQILNWSFPPGPAITSPALNAVTAVPAANNPALTTTSLIIPNATLTVARLLAEERKLWVMAIGTLLAVLLSSLLIPQLRNGNVGWSLRFCVKDFRLAACAIVLWLPLVFVVQAIVVQIPGMEYEHPLMRLLLDNPSPRLWLILGITAVVVAPIAEEFFFRGLLQGWLEKALYRRASTDPVSPGGPVFTDPTDAGQTDAAEVSPAQPTCYGPFAPILLSSAAFSAAHFNHGGGWIAIFVLALGLGILYHKTHRLLPCILLHMGLNATSLGLAYWVSKSGF